MVWYGMVWYGMVWYGMVWYGMVSRCSCCIISTYCLREPSVCVYVCRCVFGFGFCFILLAPSSKEGLGGRLVGPIYIYLVLVCRYTYVSR
ncbi:hypothetical protein F4778DRAFT_744881 [Xylariomycetidae sp. FL2044]|nr:hypothetical protein F4778DRAFT_744881 [Xylariomycetidae sp. FL2044]